jgi:hypothetical protein
MGSISSRKAASWRATRQSVTQMRYGPIRAELRTARRTASSPWIGGRGSSTELRMYCASPIIAHRELADVSSGSRSADH